jgi:hypothetical protein
MNPQSSISLGYKYGTLSLESRERLFEESLKPGRSIVYDYPLNAPIFLV